MTIFLSSYLDEIPRITAKKYIPTDGQFILSTELFTNISNGVTLPLEDVLKARLKTMGVVEHTFTITGGSQRGVSWKIYDVGGARNQRQAWAPYFDDGELCFAPLHQYRSIS
jgi:hypothetical protein